MLSPIKVLIVCGLWQVGICKKDICKQAPVEINEEFIACCRGKPVFTSEPCIDALVENGTLTDECMIDCLFKDFQFYNEGDEGLNLTAVASFFENNIRELTMRTMFINAFTRCSEFDKEELLALFSFIETTNEYDCNIFPLYMDRCVWYYTLSHCPEKNFSTDPQCMQKQSWVRTCLLK